MEIGDFFDPTPEEQLIVLVDTATVPQAERLIEPCEHCNEEGAEIPFDNILDRVTGSDPSVTDYSLETPTKRSVRTARREILEKTLVEPTSSQGHGGHGFAGFGEPPCESG
jgi:hypothetical protein